MPKVLAYYVDDQALGEAKRFQERLSRAEGFECRLIPPPSWDELNHLFNDLPDLFLLDYELSQVQPDGTKAAYQGSTLAAEIRTRFPDCPIVLITRESILDRLNRQTKRQLTEHIQVVYDELIFKSLLDDDLDGASYLLSSIAEGFHTLRNIEDKNWQSLIETLGASIEEGNILREIAPPVKEGEWIVIGAASWIRDVILKFPGIIYDPLNATVRLGISIDAFSDKTVQDLLEPAKYTGIFAPREGRWWKGRLFRIAKELTIEENRHWVRDMGFYKIEEKG